LNVIQFKVPQFLERESNIAWGLSFKNLVVAVVLGFSLFGFFYVFQSLKILWAWFILLVIVAGAFVVFNFVKIEGQSAFEVFTNAAIFIFSRRLYMWQRKEGVSPIRLAQRPQAKKKPKEAALKIAPKSRLGLLGSKINISSIIDREEFWEDVTSDEEEEGAVGPEEQMKGA
jgi:hypothetical protein